MAEQTRVLRRLPKQGQIAGVCAGLAEYLTMDVTMVRIIFIIMGLITGGGFILVYILLALVMPSAEAGRSAQGTDIGHNAQVLADDMRTGENQMRLRNFIGVGLVLLGAWLAIGQLFPSVIEQSWNYAVPIVLIVLGTYIVTRRK